MAGNWAVMNDIKNAPNKIIVPCRTLQHGEEIIKKMGSMEMLFMLGENC